MYPSLGRAGRKCRAGRLARVFYYDNHQRLQLPAISFRDSLLTMPYYRRWRVDGGVYFFTLVTHKRQRILTGKIDREMLREAFAEARERLPFELSAIVLLPDHLHMLMRLPCDTSDYSARISKIKRNFTERYLSSGGREERTTEAKQRQRYRGVWQPRFFEHTIRNYADFKMHLDYIHSNPVKHGLAASPQAWPWSSFHRYVREGEYDTDWCGHITLPGGTDIEPEQW